MDQDKFCDIGAVNADDDVDLTLAPTSGEAYLRQVIIGRTKCQSIVVADRDFSAYAAKQTKQIPEELIFDVSSSVVSAGVTRPPPKEWRERQLRDFAMLRTEFCRKRAQARQKPLPKLSFPFLGNEMGWKKFCFPNSTIEQPSSSTSSSSAIASHPNEDSTTKKPSKDVRSGIRPLLSVLAAMSPAQAADLFEFQVAWFVDEGYQLERMRWIYALMLMIEKPLTPELSSSLRDLARECIRLRRSMVIDQQSAAPDDPQQLIARSYALFAVIVAGYFDQSDLVEQ